MDLHVHGATVYAYTGTRTWLPGQETVMFVHGAAHDHSVWALQSRYIAHHGFNVLAVDLPGHGRSGGAPLSSIEALAGWALAVLDAAGAERAAMVGHSMGALTALAAAAAEPGRVARLALIGPAVPMEVSDELMDAAERDEPLAYAMINGWSFSAGAQLGGNAWPGVWMTGNSLRLMERNARGVLARDLRACAGYSGGLAAAACVDAPVLVVLGGRDVMAPARNARALIDALPRAEVLTLPRAGHALMAEEPDALLDALRRFANGPA